MKGSLRSFGTESLRSTDALKSCNPRPSQATDMDAFESPMRKKLGGKYVKPSFIDDEAKPEDKNKLDGKAKLDDKDTLDKKSCEDGDKTDGEESGQLTPPPKSVSNDITLTQPPISPHFSFQFRLFVAQ